MLGILAIILVWAVAPWAGIFTAGYVIYSYFKKEKERYDKNLELFKIKKPKTSSKPDRTADEFILYKSCTVEIFREPFGEMARILMPNGKDLGVSFESVSEAIADIDKHVK